MHGGCFACTSKISPPPKDSVFWNWDPHPHPHPLIQQKLIAAGEDIGRGQAGAVVCGCGSQKLEQEAIVYLQVLALLNITINQGI